VRAFQGHPDARRLRHVAEAVGVELSIPVSQGFPLANARALSCPSREYGSDRDQRSYAKPLAAATTGGQRRQVRVASPLP
jgi:hypothetical protein